MGLNGDIENGVLTEVLTGPDFDACTECLTDPNQRLRHNLRHAFFPIPSPGDQGRAQYETAVIVRAGHQ